MAVIAGKCRKLFRSWRLVRLLLVWELRIVWPPTREEIRLMVLSPPLGGGQKARELTGVLERFGQGILYYHKYEHIMFIVV